jgi:hypothetical protein
MLKKSLVAAVLAGCTFIPSLVFTSAVVALPPSVDGNFTIEEMPIEDLPIEEPTTKQQAQIKLSLYEAAYNAAYKALTDAGGSDADAKLIATFAAANAAKDAAIGARDAARDAAIGARDAAIGAAKAARSDNKDAARDAARTAKAAYFVASRDAAKAVRAAKAAARDAGSTINRSDIPNATVAFTAAQIAYGIPNAVAASNVASYFVDKYYRKGSAVAVARKSDPRAVASVRLNTYNASIASAVKAALANAGSATTTAALTANSEFLTSSDRIPTRRALWSVVIGQAAADAFNAGQSEDEVLGDVTTAVKSKGAPDNGATNKAVQNAVATFYKAVNDAATKAYDEAIKKGSSTAEAKTAAKRSVASATGGSADSIGAIALADKIAASRSSTTATSTSDEQNQSEELNSPITIYTTITFPSKTINLFKTSKFPDPTNSDINN